LITNIFIFGIQLLLQPIDYYELITEIEIILITFDDFSLNQILLINIGI